MELFTKIERTMVSDSVIDQITELIRSGKLKPGDQLPSEHGLSELLGVSRSSVREALKALETLGMIRRDQAGSFVNENFSVSALSKLLYTEMLTRKLKIIHLYQTRQLLETYLGALAAANLTDTELMELERLCVEMEMTPDTQVQDHVNLDKEFHRRLCDIAGNPLLTRLWELAFEVLLEVRQQIPFTAWDIRHSDKRHRLLIEALRARDPELVKETISETLEAGERNLVALLAKEGGSSKSESGPVHVGLGPSSQPKKEK